MPQFIKSFVGVFRSPEWIAAFALLIQAAILTLQWKILRRHAETMEKHTGIAGIQADTAALIGQALQQQGQIMSEQTKIMAAQLAFQKWMEAKAERTNVFDLLLDVGLRAGALKSTAEQIVLANSTPENQAMLRQAITQLRTAIIPCQKALIISTHLSKEDMTYFGKYMFDALDLKETFEIAEDIEKIKAFHSKYGDFDFRLIGAARKP
jgi:hypothetical protein